MAPPAVICPVFRPRLLTVIVKLKKTVVRAVSGKIRSRLIIPGPLVNFFCIQPFIKGTAVIKHAVQYHLHPPAVNLLNQFRKQCIACFQIFLRPGTDLVHRRITVALRALRKRRASVFDDPSVMRIDIIIILNIILMIGWRYKNRVEINNFYTKIL